MLIMALPPTRLTISTTPQPLIDGGASGIRVVACNRGTTSVYLGNSNVTSSTGYELGVGERIGISMPANGENVYAVSASGSNRVDRLQASW